MLPHGACSAVDQDRKWRVSLRRVELGRLNSGSRDDLLQLSRANNGVYFRNVLRDLGAIALNQTSRHNQLLRSSAGLVPCHLENGVDGLLFGRVDKRAGVHD